VNALQFVTIVMVCLASTVVVFTRDPLRQLMVAGITGLLLAILFFSYQAPDVALSQIVVSTVAVPIMVLLALVHIKRDEGEQEEEEDES
jgi:energy-converting hydrogenase B subunit D